MIRVNMWSGWFSAGSRSPSIPLQSVQSLGSSTWCPGVLQSDCSSCLSFISHPSRSLFSSLHSAASESFLFKAQPHTPLHFIRMGRKIATNPLQPPPQGTPPSFSRFTSHQLPALCGGDCCLVSEQLLPRSWLEDSWGRDSAAEMCYSTARDSAIPPYDFIKVQYPSVNSHSEC